MIKIKNLLKIKKVFHKKDLDINPDLYWGYTLDLTFLLILFAFVFGLYFFMNVNKEEDNYLSTVSNQENAVKQKLDNALKYFKERENKSESILNSPAPVRDPSI